VIDPAHERLHLGRSLRELWAQRELLFVVTARELRVRYKQSLLGVAWAVLQPLALMAVFTIFFSRLAKISSGDLPYAPFVYCGLLPWTFFNTSISFASNSMVANASVVKKTYCPREVFPIASVLAAGVDFFFSALVYAGLLLIYRQSIHLTAWVAFVIPLVVLQDGFALACGLILAAINAYYRDVRYVVPLLLQVWFFATPVVYQLSVIPPKYLTAYLILNPMAAIIDGYRRVTLHGQPPQWEYLAIGLGMTAVLLVGGYALFKWLDQVVADVL